MPFMRRLKYERYRLGLTQEELAKEIGISPYTLQKYEVRDLLMTTRQHTSSSKVEAFFNLSRAELYEMIEVTQDQYDISVYRSRLQAINQHNRDMPCDLCGEMLHTHWKCRVCDVLMHEENEKYICRCGIQHSMHHKDSICEYCHDRANYLMSHPVVLEAAESMG